MQQSAKWQVGCTSLNRANRLTAAQLEDAMQQMGQLRLPHYKMGALDMRVARFAKPNAQLHGKLLHCTLEQNDKGTFTLKPEVNEVQKSRSRLVAEVKTTARYLKAQQQQRQNKPYDPLLCCRTHSTQRLFYVTVRLDLVSRPVLPCYIRLVSHF